ncbi:hypothetical protein FJZ28_02870 [Candidatus Peregrinibacteria bacterium]|nr:hypothetical protein [Candidatus Peregrinibacteria bacterium]
MKENTDTGKGIPSGEEQLARRINKIDDRLAMKGVGGKELATLKDERTRLNRRLRKILRNKKAEAEERNALQDSQLKDPITLLSGLPAATMRILTDIGYRSITQLRDEERLERDYSAFLSIANKSNYPPAGLMLMWLRGEIQKYDDSRRMAHQKKPLA